MTERYCILTGLDKDTSMQQKYNIDTCHPTWVEFGTLMTPMVVFGVLIQIVSGLLSQAPEDK